ncbi:MAG: DUF6210 family protein [Spirillospora sp.]
MRYVFLDPDGGQRDWLYVVVRAETGIVYQQQYGGTANLLGGVEGYLVPLCGTDWASGRDGLLELREIFEKAMRGSGRAGGELSADLLDRVRSAVGVLHYWTSGRTSEWVPSHVPLRIDESRAGELDEAWIPVHTPDGPGVLVWDNSD